MIRSDGDEQSQSMGYPEIEHERKRRCSRSFWRAAAESLANTCGHLLPMAEIDPKKSPLGTTTGKMRNVLSIRSAQHRAIPEEYASTFHTFPVSIFHMENDPACAI